MVVNGDEDRDPNRKACKRRGFVNHGFTLRMRPQPRT